MSDEPNGAEQNGDSIEIEIPMVTAPTFPVEHLLSNSQAFFQRTIDGGMIVKFVPLVPTSRGSMPAHEATCVAFSAEGWERFKRTIAADGVPPPSIETVLHVPGGFLRNGGEQ